MNLTSEGSRLAALMKYTRCPHRILYHPVTASRNLEIVYQGSLGFTQMIYLKDITPLSDMFSRLT